MISKAKKAKAVKLSRGGASLREVAAQLGISPGTVRNAVREANSVEPKKPAAEEPAPDDDDLPTEPIARLEYLISEAQANAKDARQAGNNSACQRSLNSAAAFENILARVRKQASTDGDALRISRADLAAEMRQFEADCKAMLSRPLMCAGCGRELSASFAGYDSEAIAKALARGH